MEVGENLYEKRFQACSICGESKEDLMLQRMQRSRKILGLPLSSDFQDVESPGRCLLVSEHFPPPHLQRACNTPLPLHLRERAGAQTLMLLPLNSDEASNTVRDFQDSQMREKWVQGEI